MKATILVLGAGGFIGQRLLHALARRSIETIGVGHALVDSRSGLLTTVHGSVEDTTLLRDLLPSCSGIVYLASVTTPAASAREPGLEVTGNLLPLARLLEVALDLSPRTFVFVSSAGAVYGDCADPVCEEAILRPRSFYGAGKVAAEALLHAFTLNSNWRTTIVRPTNVYGPGQRPTKGFAIVPTIFQRLREQHVFEIWGDGSVVRDYLFADDLVELIVRALKQPQQAGFSVYNAAADCAVSVLELISACEQTSGRSLSVEFKPARGVDVSRVVPDISAVSRDFGWRAQTDLNDGLAQTWAWWAREGDRRNG